MKKNDALPPVVRLLLDEDIFAAAESPARLESLFKRLAPELHRQARWSTDNHRYADDVPRTRSGDFLLRVSGGLDPFSSTEICGEIECRVASAEQFARTVGMFADRAVVPDVFTQQFVSTDTIDGRQAFHLIHDLVVLDRLRPLVEADVVQFSDGYFRYCQKHEPDVYKQVAEAAEALMPEVKAELRFRRHGATISAFTGKLYDPPMVWLSEIPKNQRRLATRQIGLNAFQRTLEREIATVLRDLRSADRLKGILASSSRIGLMAIRSIERDAPLVKTVEHWENIRGVTLPWLRELTVEEILRVRDEASTALPRLRALIASKIGKPSGEDEGRLNEIICEIRSEAAEVEAELRTLKMSRERGFRTLTGSLGLTIAIYGLAAGFVSPAVGLGSLLSLLGLLHAAERADGRQAEQLKSRPGYVLLKAKDLVTHRVTA